MIECFERWLLRQIDRFYGLEKLALRAGLSPQDARRVAREDL